MHCTTGSKDRQSPQENIDVKNREEELNGLNHLARVQEKSTAASIGSGINNGPGPNPARNAPAEVAEEETSMTRMPILHLSILLASIWVYL
jgi:hypothetical protein